VELVYEGEVEGPVIVAQNLIGKAIRTQFLNYFPDPEKSKKSKINPFAKVIEWFGSGNEMEMIGDMPDREYIARLKTIDGLDDFVDMLSAYGDASEKLFMMEFALHGMAEYSLIGKQSLDQGIKFQDLVSSMFSGPDDEDFDFDEDDDNKGRF
jgi:magnesium chelatase subunit I